MKNPTYFKHLNYEKMIRDYPVGDDYEKFLLSTSVDEIRSIQEKRFLLVARDEEFYLLPWEHKENKEKCYVYSHYNWMTGRIFSVYRDDIELIGLN